MRAHPNLEGEIPEGMGRNGTILGKTGHAHERISEDYKQAIILTYSIFIPPSRSIMRNLLVQGILTQDGMYLPSI